MLLRAVDRLHRDCVAGVRTPRSVLIIVTPLRRFAIFVLIAAAALLGASGANAKEPSFQTTVCGRSLSAPTKRACLRFGSRTETAQVLFVSSADAFEVRRRPRPAPFYTVTIRSRDANGRYEWSFLYVPSRDLMRNTAFVGLAGPDNRRPYWRTVPLLVTVAFETLSKKLRPFPAPRRWG
jgi:hypothetical protein